MQILFTLSDIDRLSKIRQCRSMERRLRAYVPVCDAIARLLWPHAEVLRLSRATIYNRLGAVRQRAAA